MGTREGSRGEEAWQLASGHLRCCCERDLCCYMCGEGAEARRGEQLVGGGRSWPGKWLQTISSAVWAGPFSLGWNF